MIRRPRPPPVTRRLRSSGSQTTRQPASAWAPQTTRPPRRRVLAAATGHPAPGAPWSRTTRRSLGRRPRTRPARVATLLPPSSLARLAAGLLVATGQPPPPATPPPPAGWRPGTGPRSGGTTVAWAVAPRRSLPRSLRALPPSCPPGQRQPENQGIPPAWLDQVPAAR